MSEYHRLHPLRGGLAKEEWRARLHLPPKMAVEIYSTLHVEGMVAEGSAGGGSIRLPTFEPSFTELQRRLVAELLQQFRQNPYTPPVRLEAEMRVGAEVVAALIERGTLVKLGDGVLFLRETYDEAIARLVTYLREHGTMTAAQARDVLGTTRKYLLPLLEHMDIQKITQRIGDERMLGPLS
jgi:selenocysteine-specific elongation factor